MRIRLFFWPFFQLSLQLSDLLDNIGKFTVYYLHYKEKLVMTEFVEDLFLLQPLIKLLLLSGASFDYIVKFAIYYSHFKDKLVGNPNRTFVYVINYLCFLCGWNNLSAAFFLIYNCCTFTVELGSVTKKGEPPKTSLHLLFNSDQTPPFMLNLTLKNAPSDICTLGNSKCAIMCK